MRRLLILTLIATPALLGADKTTDTMLQILRDLAGLQDQMKILQQSFEGKLNLSLANAAQARAAAEQAGKSTAALGDRLQKGLQDQQDQQTKTLSTVAALAARGSSQHFSDGASPISHPRYA
ncbi:MAG TPA: hypothetical protein VIX19_22050 [Terriglobales bacterium]